MVEFLLREHAEPAVFFSRSLSNMDVAEQHERCEVTQADVRTDIIFLNDSRQRVRRYTRQQLDLYDSKKMKPNHSLLGKRQFLGISLGDIFIKGNKGSLTSTFSYIIGKKRLFSTFRIMQRTVLFNYTHRDLVLLNSIYHQGLFPVHSGIVANRFRDNTLNDNFKIGGPTADDPKWWKGEPVSKYCLLLLPVPPPRSPRPLLPPLRGGCLRELRNNKSFKCTFSILSVSIQLRRHTILSQNKEMFIMTK